MSVDVNMLWQQESATEGPGAAITFPMTSLNIMEATDAGHSARSCSKGQGGCLDVNIQTLPWKLLTQHGASFPGSGDHENNIQGLSKVARIAIAVPSSKRAIALRSNGRLCSLGIPRI